MRALLVVLAAGLAWAADDAAVDAIFADLAKSGSPGCAVGVYRDGKIVLAKGYGLANVELNVPITAASIFDIGSTSKQFTAASILLLEKEGKLKLDDDVRKYVPELPSYPGGRITILHLLNHTSGIRDYLALFSLAGINIDGVTNDDTALSLIARQKALNFAPGSDYLYSNSGFFLLSIIVQRASGKSLRDFAQQNIFTPLGMTHTQYRSDHRSLIPNRAAAYDPVRAGGFQLDLSYFEQTGDGAVHTSVEDLLKWDENFYTAEVGGRKFVADLQEPGALASGKPLDYAKGLMVNTRRGLRVVSHGGSWGGYRAELMRFPDQHFSVACLCNLATANPSGRAMKVAEVYLGSLMQPAETGPGSNIPPARQSDSVSPPVPDLAGDYASEELGVIYRLAVVNGKLTRAAILEPGGIPRPVAPAALRFVSSDQWALGGVRIQFLRDARQAITGFRADAGRTQGIVFTRIPR